MSFGTVQERGRTQKGAPKLKIDNKWMFVGRNCNTDGVEVGTYVEFETHTFGDQNNLVSLDRMRPAQKPNGSSNGGSQPSPSSPTTPPYDEAELRFISNVVGSGMTGQQIKEPAQVSVWSIAAYRALQALKAMKDEPEFNDRIPGEDDAPESEDPAPQGSRW